MIRVINPGNYTIFNKLAIQRTIRHVQNYNSWNQLDLNKTYDRYKILN